MDLRINTLNTLLIMLLFQYSKLKTMKFTKWINLLLIITIIQSCTKKQTLPLTPEQLAIKELREIVGDNGKIEIIGINPLSEKQSQSADLNKKNTLTIDQFKVLYKILNSKQIIKGINDSSASSNNYIKTNTINSRNKSMTEYADDPENPNLYQCQFVFNNIAFVTLYYRLDENNKVFNPSIQYSGIPFFGWQTSNVSGINFNQNNSISSFTFGGGASIGVNFGNFTLGWSRDSMVTFWVDGDNRTCIIAEMK